MDGFASLGSGRSDGPVRRRSPETHRYSTYPSKQSVLILPKRYELPPIQLGGASQYQPGGISLASSVGESEEFLSVREYRRGDPLRHIHWKSTSRTGTGRSTFAVTLKKGIYTFSSSARPALKKTFRVT